MILSLSYSAVEKHTGWYSVIYESHINLTLRTTAYPQDGWSVLMLSIPL